MKLIDQWLGRRTDPRGAHRPLWNAVVARGREAHWYVEGGVADTLDGRFDMIALIFSLTLLRIEASPGHERDCIVLTELFVDDMDGQMRQIGFGDMVVGKQIGRIMSALGGRIGAYRAALAAADDAMLEAALIRNLWRGEAPTAPALAHVTRAVRDLQRALAATSAGALIAAAALPGSSGA